MDPPRFPPAYTPIALDQGDSMDIACAEAATGAAPGMLFWRRRPDRLDCAVVLEPDHPLRESRHIRCAAMLALADALGALGPPKVRIAFDPAGHILINGAKAGAVAFTAAPGCAEDDVPAWAVVGVTLDVRGDPDDDSPGLHPDHTALREEGFGDLDAALPLESFARNFLSWIDLWENDGPEAVRAAWRRRASVREPLS